jgi:hypothetical protein
VLQETVQVSIFGPILCAIYISPLFDKFFKLAFAYDTFIPTLNQSLPQLMESMKKTIEVISKWLKKSGRVVYKNETESCLKYKKDTAPVTIKINSNVTSKKVLNVLGELFDMKLTWAPHVEELIMKAN